MPTVNPAPKKQYVINLSAPHSRILNTLASCPFHTAVGLRDSISHTTIQPSVSLQSAPARRGSIPAHEPRITPDKSYGRDFGDMPSKDIYRTRREVFYVYKARLCPSDKAHVSECRSTWAPVGHGRKICDSGLADHQGSPLSLDSLTI
jgi:hypothetical protein